VIRVYALATGLRRLPDLDGVGEETLEVRTVNDVTAVVSTADGSPREPSREDLIRHGLVVEHVHDLADAVLPVRYGATFPDSRSLTEVVSRRNAGLHRQLARVRGCVEIGVCLLGPQSEPMSFAATSGAAHMRRQLIANALWTHARTDLERQLRHFARDHVVAGKLARGSVFEVAYLVPRQSVGAVRALVDQFAAEHPEATVVCTGPWAPYSFADELNAV